MLKSLILVTVHGIFAGQFQTKRKTRLNLPKAAQKLLIVLFIGYLAFFIGFVMFQPLAKQLIAASLPELYFALVALFAILLSVFTSIMSVQKAIFDAKDNDLLLSMPIKPSAILAVRLIGQYLYALVISAVLAIPASLAFWLLSPPAPVSIIFFLIGLLLLPGISLAISLLIGWLVAAVSSRMRNKNALTFVLSIAFLGAYFVAVSQMNEWISQVVAAGSTFFAAIKRIFYPAAAFAEAVAHGNVIAMLLLVVATVLPLALVTALLSYFFLRIVTHVPGQKKIVYLSRIYRTRSPLGALLAREWRHYLSNSLVLLNTAIGAVMLVFLAGYLLIAPQSLQAIFSELNLPAGSALFLLIPILAFITTTSVITASSISIEGQTFWLLKTLPLQIRTVLLSKILFQVSVLLPPLLLAMLSGLIAFGGTPVSIAAALILPLLFLLLIAQLGLAFNLKFHRFDYISDVYAVKQSMSVILTMLCGWAIIGLSIFAVIRLQWSLIFSAAIIGVMLIALNGILFFVLSTWGVKRFDGVGTD